MHGIRIRRPVRHRVREAIDDPRPIISRSGMFIKITWSHVVHYHRIRIPIYHFDLDNVPVR